MSKREKGEPSKFKIQIVVCCDLMQLTFAHVFWLENQPQIWKYNQMLQHWNCQDLTLALAICFAIKNELPVCLKEVLRRIIDRIKLEHFTIFP